MSRMSSTRKPDARMLSMMGSADSGRPASIRMCPALEVRSSALNPLVPTYHVLPNSGNGRVGAFHDAQLGHCSAEYPTESAARDCARSEQVARTEGKARTRGCDAEWPCRQHITLPPGEKRRIASANFRAGAARTVCPWGDLRRGLATRQQPHRKPCESTAAPRGARRQTPSPARSSAGRASMR